MLRLFVPLLALLASSSAFGLPGQCRRYLMECNDGGYGLLLLPVIFLLQIALLYLVVGGPEEFLNRLTKRSDSGQRETWGGVQVAIPIAAVLSFPPAIVLLLIDYLLWRIGVIETLATIGIFWWWLTHWLGRLETDDRTPGAAPAKSQAAPFAAAMDPALLPRRGSLRIATPVEAPPGEQALPEPPTPAASPEPVAPPVRMAPIAGPDNQVLLGQLTKAFMWEEIGLSEPFLGIRKQSPAAIEAGIGNGQVLSPALAQTMREIARHTIASVRHGTQDRDVRSFMTPLADEGFDEYAIDVMQRLTYSILFNRDRLFINQLDVDVFGEDFLVASYGIALTEFARSNS